MFQFQKQLVNPKVERKKGSELESVKEKKKEETQMDPDVGNDWPIFKIKLYCIITMVVSVVGI